MAACPSPSGGGGGSQTYTATVTGTVQDNAGAKLPGATVSASTTPPVTTTTDLDGAFSLRVNAVSSAFTLTVAKTCYRAPSAKSITLAGNGPLDTGATTLTLTLLPTTASDDDRYTFTQKPDGSYKLTVNCVTEIPASEFSTVDAPGVVTESSILRRLATESGKAISEVLTEIELPPPWKRSDRAHFTITTR